jgi:hypothetical protein
MLTAYSQQTSKLHWKKIGKGAGKEQLTQLPELLVVGDQTGRDLSNGAKGRVGEVVSVE